jgi:hypothetical protein
MEDTSVILAAIRALVNELKTACSLPEEWQDEEQHLCTRAIWMTR